MSEFLLDTHVLLWWLFNDGRLSYTARDLIRARDNRMFVSAASAWEIATKRRIGKLPEAENIVEALPSLLARSRIASMDITFEDALFAGSLDHEHRDPFDRMIMAQAALRKIPIVTNDRAFRSGGAEVVW